jgi:hypothetical protein
MCLEGNALEEEGLAYLNTLDHWYRMLSLGFTPSRIPFVGGLEWARMIVIRYKGNAQPNLEEEN